MECLRVRVGDIRSSIMRKNQGKVLVIAGKQQSERTKDEHVEIVLGLLVSRF